MQRNCFSVVFPSGHMSPSKSRGGCGQARRNLAQKPSEKKVHQSFCPTGPDAPSSPSAPHELHTLRGAVLVRFFFSLLFATTTKYAHRRNTSTPPPPTGQKGHANTTTTPTMAGRLAFSRLATAPTSRPATVAPLVGGVCLGFGLWTTTSTGGPLPKLHSAVVSTSRRHLASGSLLSDDLHHSIGVNLLE